MDDWVNHPWFQREKRLLKFTEAELRNLSAEDFRFFFFGHPKPSHAIEFFIGATRESGIPEQLVPEVVRWIQATGRIELMPTLLKANHPTITLYLLKTQPKVFKAPTEEDVISWSKDGCYLEIVYQMCTIPWEKLGKKNVWDSFFSIIQRESEDLILSDLGMTDYLLSSQNCSLEQLKFLLDNFVETANDVQLLWRNLMSRNVNPFMVADGAIGVQVLKLIVSQHSKALFSLLEEILKSAHIAQHMNLAFEVVSRSKMSINLRNRALTTLGQNRNINAQKMITYCVNCPPLFKGLLRREDLLQDIPFADILDYTSEDDMLAELLEHQGSKVTWTPALIDRIFAHIFDDGILTSIAFAKIQSLPLDVVENLIETNDYCKLQVASRPDLLIAQRDNLLGVAEVDVRVAILRHDDRPHVQKQYAAKDVQFLEALAVNPKLVCFAKDPLIRKALLEYNGKSAFRVHRCLAARPDVSDREIELLLLKRDLDIYSNLCRNKHLKLTRENVLTLTNFAQVSEEQQDEWLPCLRLTHRKANEAELRRMLLSYQSEMRLLLLRGDSEFGLGRVDNEMKLSWTSDPDFSVTLGILQSGGEKLSNYMMQCIVDNDANVHLLEDKLLSLLPRCDDMNLETLLMVVKKGTPKVCKEILRLLPGGAKLHSLVHTANASQLPVELQLLHSDAFASPKNYIFILRAIFERQRTQADIMKAVILLLKDLVKQLGPKYEKNEDHLRTQIEDLLLDICTDLRVPREVMDEVVSIASSTVLYHLLSYGNLNYETLWAIYLKEVENAGRNSPLLRCLALRNSVPSTMRWVLALVNSRLGQESDGSVRNELLSVMLSGGNSIDKTLVHYFLCNEPEETVAFLHSTDLQGEELIFLRDKMLPSLKESHPVRQHFEIFAAAVSKLCGTPITLAEIKFETLTSKIMNDTIGYARDGIQLQKLAEFITKDLGIKFPTTLIDNLLQALRFLFEEPEKKAEKPPRFAKGAAGDDDENEANEAEAVHSLPITSLQKAREQFPKIILACDLQQYLVKFINAGLLAIEPDMTRAQLITVPAAHADLFGPNFAAAANEQLEKLLKFAFTSEVSQRKAQFTAPILKKLFESKYPSLERIKELWIELQIPQDSIEFKLLTLLVSKGFAKAQVRDLHWLSVRLFEIATSVVTRNKSTDEKVSDIGKLESVFLTPLLNAERVLQLPYSAVFAFCELLPDASALVLPTRVLTLCQIWGTPQQTDNRTCDELMLRVGSCLDVVEKSGKECLKATLDLLGNNKMTSSLIDQRLALKRGQLSLEILVPDTQTTDVATHVCNMESVEEAIYAAITKFGVSICTLLTALFEHHKATLKLHNLDFKVRPVSELRSAEVLSAELLQSLIDHKSNAIVSSAASFASLKLDTLCEYLAPYRHLIVIQPIVFVKGTRAQMIPGNLLFRLREFLPANTLAESKMTALPLCLEIADYITHRVEPAWLDSKEPLSAILKLNLDQLLQLPDAHNYAYLSSKELSVCRDQVRALYQRFVADKQKSITSLLSCAKLSLLMQPDFEKLEKKKVFETEPLPGIFMVQHALMLDENSMPIIQDGELQRDPNSAKTRQPVMRIVELEKEVPTAKKDSLPLLNSSDAVCSNVPAFHITSLLQRQQAFEERLERALEITWNSINKPYLKDLIAEFEETQRTGSQLNLPSGKVGPPYAYLIVPQEAFYSAKMNSLRMMLNNVGAQTEKCIKDFQLSRRPSLPMEMLTYVSLLEGCAFKEESKLRRLAEAAMCAQVMASDVNYHVLLEDTSIIKFLSDIVKRIGERLLQVEAQKNGGSLLICFPCSAKGLGIMCVSSTFKKSTKTWQRFLHYNPNACAAEEFHRCTEHTPPYALGGGGIVFEEIFAGANKRNILLSFTKQAIKQKKAALNAQAKEAIQKGDVHDESHLGRNLNLGHINWVVRKDDDQLTLNHLHCEAALCNASPLIPLEVVQVPGEGSRLQLKVTFASVRETLEKCLRISAASHK